MIIGLVLTWLSIQIINLKDDLIQSYLKAVTIWMVFVFMMTECLSQIRFLNRISIIVTWTIVDIGLFLYVKKNWKILDIRNKMHRLIKEFKPYFILAIIISFLSIYLAIRTTPYNWDSMTYHLSRIAHWRQNQSIAHYSTNIIRQVASPVLAEIVVLQSYIVLNGNDILVNLLQSTSYITNAIIVFKIARKIGCKIELSFLSMFLFMTTPIAFAESLTTQVDNFSALWMLIFTYYILDFLNPKEKIEINSSSIQNVLVIGACIAFGYLCKPSVSISMVIFAIWLLIVCAIRKDNIFSLLKLAGYSLFTLLPPVGIEIFRNLCSFGKISASITGQRQLVGTLNPAYILLNFVKNIAYNLPNIYLR